MDRRRAAGATALLLSALLLIGVCTALAGNGYRLTETTVDIPVPGGTVEAVIASPDTGEPRGTVLFVHGDGPVDATHDGLYRPWWEAAADAGYTTVSWSKPGVGGSSGDWLDQDMDDRAAEVSAVIDWLAEQPGTPPGPLGLWGASQAGWVLPKVAAERDDVDFVVAVSPAVNWLRQGRFHLLAELDRVGADPAERDRAVADSDRTRELLAAGADYRTYRAGTTDPRPMDPARWDFARLNFRADATADLRALSERGIPVLLMLGDHDLNVDVDETARVYTRLLGPDLRVERFDAAHSLARPAMEESALLGVATAVLWPRALFAPGTLDAYRSFLGRVRS
ncbi:S9 family peptidase [Nocardiopsis sp. CC223A]|uniref:alpha/beta hydrolase family protein n=1 Tax=Nocardiopsis sp. CC223A TaxID=3044051 RepID=UPI002795D476|nr:CocE/NonD family hydrolase [Nocardiopsis sp. CC223A]